MMAITIYCGIIIPTEEQREDGSHLLNPIARATCLISRPSKVRVLAAVQGIVGRHRATSTARVGPCLRKYFIWYDYLC